MPAEMNDEKSIIDYVLACRRESDSGRTNRMELNRDNYAMYQLEYNFSHKAKGQSKEVLSKTRNSTEQIKSFFQQALADLGDWWSLQARDGTDGSTMLVTPDEMKKLVDYMLKKSSYFSHVGFSCQSGLLGSLAISKVHGCMIPKPKYITRKEGKGRSYKKSVVMIEDKSWELRFNNLRQDDYYPDPHGAKLYEVEDCFVDLHELKKYSVGDDAIYDSAAVNALKPWGSTDLKEERKAQETGQNPPSPGVRSRVKVTEFWGTIVDIEGNVTHENVVVTIANDMTIIRKPTDNPLWHQKSPYIAAALIEVANSVWGIALMDAGTKHSKALTEMFNLILDSAMKAVWGVNQIRVDVLDDPKQITDGVPWGTNLKVNAALPVGGKVMEPVITGEIQQEVITVFNLITQETLTSMMTNDMRMGAQSFRQVKATEVAAAENSITSVFQGMAKNFEEKKIQPELEVATYTVAQNWDIIDKSIFTSLFGEKRGLVLSQLEPQEVFVSVANGMKFEVFGISLTLRRQADFRKWTTLLQVVSGSEVLVEAFLQKYSFEKFLGEVMTALDINKSKISADAAPMPPGMPGGAPAAPGGAEPPAPGPNQVSQQPSAAKVTANPLAAAFGNMQAGGQQ